MRPTGFPEKFTIVCHVCQNAAMDFHPLKNHRCFMELYGNRMVKIQVPKSTDPNHAFLHHSHFNIKLTLLLTVIKGPNLLANCALSTFPKASLPSILVKTKTIFTGETKNPFDTLLHSLHHCIQIVNMTNAMEVS